MPQTSGVYRSHEINFSRYVYSTEQIYRIDFAIERIKQFYELEITEQNFQTVCSIWKLLISVIPLPVIHADVEYVLRSRPSKEREIFEDAADLSYNSKCPHLITPGRFNKAQEPVFYGVLPSEEQGKPVSRCVNAATIESQKELIDEKNPADILYFHLCPFKVKEPFPVLNLCFEERVLKNHPYFNKLVTDYIQILRSKVPHESAEAILKFWRNISQLSSVRKFCEQHYMVSTALFHAIREYYEFDGPPVNGLIYPSPMVYGDAVNIVLMPHAVDRWLVAEDCYIMKYIRNRKKRKSYTLDMCGLPSKVKDGKLNIKEVVWGKELGHFSF